MSDTTTGSSRRKRKLMKTESNPRSSHDHHHHKRHRQQSPKEKDAVPLAASPCQHTSVIVAPPASQLPEKVSKRAKKEHDAESTSSVPRKIRLVVRERSALTVLDDARVATDARGAAEALHKYVGEFARRLPPIDVGVVVSKLASAAVERTERHIRADMLALLKQALALGGDLSDFPIWQTLEPLRKLVMKPAAAAELLPLKRQLLSIWRLVIERQRNQTVDAANRTGTEVEIRQSVCLWLIDHMDKLDWHCKLNALRLLSSCIVEDVNAQQKSWPAEIETRLETVFGERCCDQDSRVRAAAAEALRRLYECRPPMSDDSGADHCHFSAICALLDDSAPAVRISGLQILRLLAAANPDKRITRDNRQSVTLRLVDDCFSRLCHAMHDLSAQVRTVAAELLGTFEGVSESFLIQTLDKKLMSRMRWTTASVSTGQRGGGGRQEWSSGRRLGEDIPAERVDEDSVSLIPSGACGAFVTGLEDEFLAVRRASIRSLSTLAAFRSHFAKSAIVHLSDMFNDEIEAVRLDAVNAMLPLIKHGLLDEDQTDIVLNVLDDATSDSRAALRELLSECRMSSLKCVEMTVSALLNNLRRFPADKESVWMCMRHFGRNHSKLIQPLVNDLLGTHPFLEVPEPKIADPIYIARLVLVLNAAKATPTIRSLFASHTWRHYRFLLHISPHLVSALTQEPSTTTDSGGLTLSLKSGPQQEQSHPCLAFLKRAFSRLTHTDASPTLALIERRTVLKLLSRDLATLPTTDDDSGAGTVFALTLFRLLLQLDSCTNALLSDDTRRLTLTAESLRKALTSCVRLESLFWGVDELLMGFVRECRLRVLASLFVAVSNDAHCVDQIDAILAEYVSELMTDEKDKGVSNELLEALSVRQSLKGSSDADAILSALAQHPATPPPIQSPLSCAEWKCCVVTEPRGNGGDAGPLRRCVGGLLTAIPLSATLYGFTPAELTRIRLHVVLPDQSEQFVRPRTSDLRRISSHLVRLRSRALVSTRAWTDRASIAIGVVLLHDDADAALRTLVDRLPTDTLTNGTTVGAAGYTVLSEHGGVSTEQSYVHVVLHPRTRC